MFRHLKKELKIRDEPEFEIIDVPEDPQKFYEDFGFLPHPRLRDQNGQPVLVKNLTPYQHEFWRYPGNALAIKSQKIGLTTSSLMEDFQYTILPEGAGMDVLVIAQSQLLANDHIRTLRNLIYNSGRYHQFLITSPDVFKDEKTKSSVIYVRNQYNKKRLSRIIGLGKSELSVWSWKNVGKVHMSDVAKIDLKEQKPFFGAVYSRLANTNGIIKIETPPNGQRGEIYNIYNKSRKGLDIDPTIADTFAEDPGDHASKFNMFEYPAKLAVEAGLITQEFLDQERHELGDSLFSQLYECNFLPPGNQWYDSSMIYTADYGVSY